MKSNVMIPCQTWPGPEDRQKWTHRDLPDQLQARKGTVPGLGAEEGKKPRLVKEFLRLYQETFKDVPKATL